MIIQENDCFYEISNDTANIEEYFKTHFEQLSWGEHESLWNLALVPLDVLLQNPILAKINNQFEIEGAGFIRMDPKECYKWHVDFSRGVAVNMHMNPLEELSLCMFETEEINKERIKYLTLHYQPNTFYLFNTQINHSIITFARTRYLFTLQFKQPKEELSYYDVLNYWTSLTNSNKEV
jgi:hypothetical protein